MMMRTATSRRVGAEGLGRGRGDVGDAVMALVSVCLCQGVGRVLRVGAEDGRTGDGGWRDGVGHVGAQRSYGLLHKGHGTALSTCFEGFAPLLFLPPPTCPVSWQKPWTRTAAVMVAVGWRTR